MVLKYIIYIFFILIIYIYTANDDEFIPNCDIINEKEQVCLLVGSAIENPVVYMQVIQV